MVPSLRRKCLADLELRATDFQVANSHEVIRATGEDTSLHKTLRLPCRSHRDSLPLGDSPRLERMRMPQDTDDLCLVRCSYG